MHNTLLAVVAVLGMWCPGGAWGQGADAPEVYLNPDLCEGVILLGRCFHCPWDGPVTSGSGGFRPPVELKIESGDFVCGCADAWRPSQAKPDCEITRLTEDELSTVG